MRENQKLEKQKKMPKYKVPFKQYVYITVTVDAESPKEAIDIAYDEGPSLTGFCGNGGTDKLVGVYGDNISIYADDDVEDDGEPELVDEEP